MTKRIYHKNNRLNRIKQMTLDQIKAIRKTIDPQLLANIENLVKAQGAESGTGVKEMALPSVETAESLKNDDVKIDKSKNYDTILELLSIKMKQNDRNFLKSAHELIHKTQNRE